VGQPHASFLPHHSLGDCYKAQGKPEKALAPYLRALELLGRQEGTQCLRLEMQLKVAVCLYQLDRWADSLSILEEVGRSEAEKSC
jgi:tetratricopeptide (TPR) repeat protein